MDEPKNKGGIYWLASYPKSGNTWFRVFLAHLIKSISPPPKFKKLEIPEDAIILNHIKTGQIASARLWIDQTLGFDSADLTLDELDLLRPQIYAHLGLAMNKPSHHKIHDAYTKLPTEKPLIPSEGCLGALYFIRNPLDVAISFAHHSHCSIDQSIKNMHKPNFAFCKSAKRQDNQLRQWLLSWSKHVESWEIAQENMPVQFIRYEDMKLNPIETFTKAARFLQIEATDTQIIQAIEKSNIKNLQALEKDNGFREKSAKAASFFRKGIVGDWQETLTSEQILQIIADHQKVMLKYGYLDKNGEPKTH